MTEFVSVESALKEKGIAPSDIDLLIISHLHFDHAGGMAYFKGTKAAENVYIAEGDLRNAYYDALTRGEISPYCKESFDLEVPSHIRGDGPGRGSDPISPGMPYAGGDRAYFEDPK